MTRRLMLAGVALLALAQALGAAAGPVPDGLRRAELAISGMT